MENLQPRVCNTLYPSTLMPYSVDPQPRRGAGGLTGRARFGRKNVTSSSPGFLGRTRLRWQRASEHADATAGTQQQQRCAWFKLQGTNLALRFESRGMSAQERCDYRYASLSVAKAACERARDWCGGASRDDGIECGRHGKLQFELRQNSSVGSARGNSWLYWCTAGTMPVEPPRVRSYQAPPLLLPRWDAPERPAACAEARCPRLRDVFVVIMTSARYHSTRCPLIKQTYAATLPADHFAFYSDVDEASLPAIRVEEMPFPGAQTAGGNPYLRAQLRWPAALRRAHATSVALGTRWTMVVDDDTYVLPLNVLRVLRPYDSRQQLLLGQPCGETRMCGGAGWVMSAPLHAALVAVLPRCRARSNAFVDAHSDAFLGFCMKALLNTSVTPRIEFNSAEPKFYESVRGRDDRPRGYGAPATFHYVKKYEDWLVLHHLTSWAAHGHGAAHGPHTVS